MSGQKFSLSFARRIEKRSLQPSAISSDGPQQQEPALQVLKAIDENTLKTDERAVEEQQLVIPMVQGNRSSILRRAQEESQKKSEDGGKDGEEKNDDGGKDGEEKNGEGGKEGKEKNYEGGKEGGDKNNENGKKEGGDGKKDEAEEKKPLTLEEQAASALLEESQRRLEQWEERESDANLTVAAATQDNYLGTALSEVGKEATLDDYEQVDVASYGAALLRGMGWKKSEGIGRIGKRVVEIIDPSTKAFNLARKSQGSSKEGEGQRGAQEGEEELPLVKGSFIFLHSGRHRGTYGMVETVDEDHVLVKAAVSHTMIREVELNLRVVTHREYKESSRVINKDMYDKYKEEEARKKEELRKKSKYSDLSNDTSEDDRKKGSKESKTLDRYKETSEQSERNKQESKTHKSRNEREESAKETKQRLDLEYNEKSYKSSRKEEGKTKNEIMGRTEESRRDSDRHPEKYGAKDRTENDDHKKVRVKENLDRNWEDSDTQTHEKSRRQEWETESSDCRRNWKNYNSLTHEKLRAKKEQEERHFDNRERNQEKHGSQTSGKSKEWKECDKEKSCSDSGMNKLRERRKLEEERRHSEKERIQEKYGSHASSRSHGKRAREDGGYSQSSKKVERPQDWMSAAPWVRENLRVRLISRTYKEGKYYKEKVIVRCVVTAESCECEAEGGQLLEDIHPAWLETVIPKVPPQIVMIVKGDSKGQCGRILQLHKDQEKASIQLLDDETVIMKRHYDDICEYVHQ